jgi:hypothetical protein
MLALHKIDDRNGEFCLSATKHDLYYEIAHLYVKSCPHILNIFSIDHKRWLRFVLIFE